MAKINIRITNLRMRRAPGLNAGSNGFATKGIHEYSKTYFADGYTGYLIENGYGVAGIKDDVEVIREEGAKPEPVERDITKDQVSVKTASLRIREEATTKSLSKGLCTKGMYDVLDIDSDNDYTGYKIGEDAWIAGIEEVEFLGKESIAVEEPIEIIEPRAVEEDFGKDQIYVDVILNIRTLPSTSGKKIGTCSKGTGYNVLEVIKGTDYTWYSIGMGAGVAGVEEVMYQAKGSHTKELEDVLAKLKINIEATECVIAKSRCSACYEQLMLKLKDLNKFIEEGIDLVDGDLVDEKEYDEIDLIYTTDIHGYSKGYHESSRVQTNFAWQDLNIYRNKLAKNGIKSLLVNCGDIIHGSSTANSNYGEDVVNWFNNLDMFASVFGNHEWRYNDEAPGFQERVSKIESMTCCNLLDKETSKPAFKPYRTAKIGRTKIGIIGVGFPGFDGGRGNTSEYNILTGDDLYRQIQKYIDELKDLDMNYIFCLAHLGISGVDERAGGNVNLETIIKNTSGLTALFPGHSHANTDQIEYRDKDNNKVYIVAQPRCDLAYISRVRLNDGGITSSLIDHI